MRSARIAAVPRVMPDDWWPSSDCVRRSPTLRVLDADELGIAVVAFRAWARAHGVTRASFGHLFVNWMPHRDNPTWVPASIAYRYR